MFGKRCRKEIEFRHSLRIFGFSLAVSDFCAGHAGTRRQNSGLFNPHLMTRRGDQYPIMEREKRRRFKCAIKGASG